MTCVGSWPVDIVRREYPYRVRLYVESVARLCEGETEARVHCPHLCPLDYRCRLWRKPECALKAILFIVPYPDDEGVPYRIAFTWEEARDFALKLAREARVREEIRHYFETEVRPRYDTSSPVPASAKVKR
jgi:hypothetical protein